jgi:hypothetical protein
MSGSTQEEWRVVPGFDGWYEVSSTGRVRSWRLTRYREARRDQPRVLRGAYTALGYHLVKLTHPVFGAMDVGVHQMVLAAFVGPRPELMVCDHINATPSDNRVENLRWVTSAENHRHSVALGRSTGRVGPRSFSPLDAAKVRAMRERRREGASLKTLAEAFDVSTTTVSKVVNHLIWREVQL